MGTTICGLDRSALKWRSQEWVEDLMIHDMARLSNEPIKSCFAAIVDPEKLAAVIGEMLRGFGFLIVENGDDPGDDMRFPATKVFVENGTVAMHLYKTWKDCEDEPSCVERPMPAARDLALRLLQLPKDATTEDALREVEKRS